MKTTLNVHTEVLEKIVSAAQTANISKSRMIVLLIMKVLAQKEITGSLGMPVRYQRRRKRDEWHKLHACFREDEYEYFSDLRRILKMSVSLILSYAVEKYLGEKNNLDNSDNYPFRNYILIKDHINDTICWKHIWGYPLDIGSHLR